MTYPIWPAYAHDVNQWLGWQRPPAGPQPPAGAVYAPPAMQKQTARITRMFAQTSRRTGAAIAIAAALTTTAIFGQATAHADAPTHMQMGKPRGGYWLMPGPHQAHLATSARYFATNSRKQLRARLRLDMPQVASQRCRGSP